jgi:hypothetical protein
MANRTKFTKPELIEIRKLYDESGSLDYVAGVYEFSRTKARALVTQAGGRINGRGRPRKTKA